MFRQGKVFSVLAALLMALVLSVGSVGTVGTAHAQTPPGGCDTTGTVNGSATPAYGTVGSTIILRASGFQPGEDTSFFFTLPNGNVFGTPSPLPGGVNGDGTIGPLPLDIDQALVNVAPGRWAITFVGARSNNTAVIYFCVLTPAQATAVAQPTNTAVPPTNTAVPPTNTAVPATATTVIATSTVVPAVTVTEVTTSTVVPVSPTLAVETPTSVPTSAVTTVPTVETPAVPPTATAELPTATVYLPPTVAAPPPGEMMPTAVPGQTPVVPGMPGTGQSDTSLLAGLVVLALSLLAVGMVARRAWSNHR